MTLLERIRKADERKLPSNVVPMGRPDRREKPRWIERMEHHGLPDKDYTGKVAA